VKTVGSALTNQWHVMVGIVLLCLLVAAAAILVRKPSYDATSTLLVDERQSSSQGFDLALQASQVLGQQYIDMIVSYERYCLDTSTFLGVEPVCVTGTKPRTAATTTTAAASAKG